VLIRLNVAPYGGNYGVLHRALRRYNIDTSQFADELGVATDNWLRTATIRLPRQHRADSDL